MGLTAFGWPTDNVIASSNPVLHTGTLSAQYGITHLHDLRTDWFIQMASVANLRITGDFGAAITLAWVTLHNIQIDAGAAVVFQLHSSPITSSTSDITVPITIPARTRSRRPNVRASLSGLAAKRYWSLFVPANAVNLIEIGEMAIWDTRRTFVHGLLPGVTVDQRRPISELSTDEEASTVYDFGVTLREISGEMTMNAVDDAALSAWWDDALGRVDPVLFIRDEDVNDVMLARLSTVHSRALISPDIFKATVRGTELSPGAPLT